MALHSTFRFKATTIRRALNHRALKSKGLPQQVSVFSTNLAGRLSLNDPDGVFFAGATLTLEIEENNAVPPSALTIAYNPAEVSRDAFLALPAVLEESARVLPTHQQDVVS